MESLVKVLKNKYVQIAIIALFFCLIVISRRIDAVTYPQFYAEDGVFWYSEAYHAENFWEPFLVPKQGYFQTVSRIGGFIGNLVDINYAPLTFNLIAIFFEILPALFFLSKRFNKIVPQFYIRFLLGVIYLSLLGTAETHANLTNVQWRLALLMFLITIAPQSKKTLWKIFDHFFLLLSGLSGPFVFFVLPVALIYYYYKKTFKLFYSKITILIITAMIQFYSYFFIISSGMAARSEMSLGANFINFFKIISGNIFIRGVLSRKYTKLITHLEFWWDNGYLPVIIGIIGMFILCYVLWKACLEIKLLIVFTFLVFFAALASPQGSLTMPQWEYLAGGSGGRYYFLPRLAWLISILWLLFNAKIKPLRYFAGLLIFSFIFLGLKNDWTFDKFHNYHFQKQVEEFKSLELGQSFEFKIQPGWKMVLEKK